MRVGESPVEKKNWKPMLNVDSMLFKFHEKTYHTNFVYVCVCVCVCVCTIYMYNNIMLSVTK